MKELVFDLEGNGFYPSKLHCIASSDANELGLSSTTNYDEMRKLLTEADVLIGHNIVTFDIPTVERLLGIKIKARLIDTLALSWYLYPDRLKHGLESWGEELGHLKPPIDDWENLEPEVYCDRCESDVHINHILWQRQKERLLKIYGSQGNYERLIAYLTFKMTCASEQYYNRWKLDKDKAIALQKLLMVESEAKMEELKAEMPKIPVFKVVNKPKDLYKRNGSLSVAGANWIALVKQQGFPETREEPITVLAAYNQPNPRSSQQVKDWLYGLGWKPETFEFKRNKDTGEERKIPQVNKKGEGLCPSVKRLIEDHPELATLEGLSIIQHRMAVVNGMLDNVDEEGYVRAEIGGLTNTLRFKHRVLVNLPGVDKLYGGDIRGCLIAPAGYVLGGSDMSSLEDRTKQHYIWQYDPDYVEEMRKPGFDPHLDLALSAGRIDEKGVEDYRGGNKKPYDGIRKMFKGVNYAGVYGAGALTISRAAKCTVKEAESLIDAYWKRNWSVKQVAKDQVVKTVEGQMWLYNPVSRLWYSLRYEKDRFSTLNQGTGVWCFDNWIREVRKLIGNTIIGQFHDEFIWLVKDGEQENQEAIVQEAMKKVNLHLNLNIELGCSVQFGNSYADIH